MGRMDLNKDKVTALVFAHLVWIVAAAVPYVTTPGTGAVLVFGAGLDIRRHARRWAPVRARVPWRAVRDRERAGRAGRRTGPQSPTITAAGLLLVLVEVILIVTVANWSFRRVETARAGFPIEYALERASFNAAIATFANANLLLQEAKLARESGTTDAEKEAQAVALIEEGLDFNRGVTDAFLPISSPNCPSGIAHNSFADTNWCSRDARRAIPRRRRRATHWCASSTRTTCRAA